ncbi:MAG: hypothetical protein ISS28_04070 [Candidatus Cloacimonetes bacterium]|nr:hypothetical protein [Candidatus Cloacimonadota bacterium]MBL7086261.1 hypothetical protein [Candidatus Cloacimonadota bacterium]
MKIVIFEDNRWKNFLPLTYTRAAFDLKCGILKLRQKIAYFYQKNKIHLIVRKDFKHFYSNRFPQKPINNLDKGCNLFINGTILMNNEITQKLNSLQSNTGLFYKNTCLGFKKDIESNTEICSENIPELIENISYKEVNIKPINYLWELVDKNAYEIEKDFKRITKDKHNNLDKNGNYHLVNPEMIFIGKGVTVEPNVVLDASNGSIYLDDYSKVMANTVIKGPVYLGKNSIVKVSAKIYEGTSVGKVCKVGGEIEETIFQGYSNKQHDGFIGHSYIGEWVNLGADTNNSDLKNNYKTVKVYFYPEEKYIDTNLQFFGMIIGDHSKSGINTMFNTGCVIGVGCNLYSADLFSGFIPSFSWGTASHLMEYKINKMLEVIRLVKNRRHLNLEDSEVNLLEKCFKNSIKLRKVHNR